MEQEAEASKNAAIFSAEAEKQSTIAGAQAEAEQARLSGEGERSRRAALAAAEEVEGKARGNAEKLRREAIAQAVQREGEAEAAAVLAMGHAEAEAMDKRAQAFREYGDAAILEMVVRVMPEVVRAAAEPISGVDKMTVISTDGASQLARNVATNLEQGMQIGSDLTGLDLRALFAQMGARGAHALAGAGGDAGAGAGAGEDGTAGRV